MRKILLLTSLLLSAVLTFAQVDEKERRLAMQLVEANKVALGLTDADLNEVIVHTAYQIPSSDIRMVYLQQGYKGLPVFNQMQVLAFKSGKVVSNAGGLLPQMEQRTKNQATTPSVSALEAMATAFRDRNMGAPVSATAASITQNGRKYDFGKQATTENITAELMWLPTGEGKEVRLVWQVFLTPQKSSDYWLVRVDAFKNTVIDIQNLTITCNWDGEKHSTQEHFANKHFTTNKGVNYVLAQDQNTRQWQYRPFVVNNASYRVIKYPAESPIHPGGAHTIHTNPWTWAPGPATALGWHFDGTTYYDSTRGNNAWAYDDRANANAAGRSALSTTAQPDLTFDFTPDYTLEPTVRTPAPNQQFNTTNLFYWNNLMHDVAYIYGFTEAARNFQNNNQGLGGAGNDYVQAEAQDGSGTNNANFATPADGTRPRMQMYLWTAPTPDRDGDVDNGIIAHEYTHGISNRLTGSGLGCLGNAEQMGEGWSDYYALMVTHDWATALPGDGFSKPRGVGTYALNQPITGVGIRQFPYTTNMAINPMTYNNLPTVVHPHGTGTIWCTVLWDMTWEIIQQAGINPNLFQVSPTITGGNNIALKLVQEGLRLQPCSPGFIDGRNAILKADTLFFGAQYSCAIIRAFARRGMGLGASQGSSGSRTDQVVSFNDGGSNLSLTQTAPLVLEGQNITYTNTVEALCSPFNNYSLVDTLPTTVTYVSGGVYNPADRTVTFSPVNAAVGSPQSFSFTVNVNAGTYFSPIDYLNDPVAGPPPAIPATWTATSNTANVWVVSNAQSTSPSNSYFTPNAAIASHQVMRTTNQMLLNNFPSSRTILSFYHSYNTEQGWDGGVVEISTNNGSTWTDLGSRIILNPYDGALGTAATNQLSGRLAFHGNSGGFKKTEIDLTSFAGQNILIRFRFGSDDNTAPVGGGWYIDDILIRSEAYVTMRSNLFNASMARVRFADTISRILPAVCTPPSIVDQPASIVRCSGGGNVNLTVNALGTALTYQWEQSTNGGTSWSPITGATNPFYTLANPTSASNGYLYRVVVTGFCGAVTSNAAVLYVSPVLTHSAVTATPSSTCAPGASAITGTVSGGTAANAVIGSTGLINLPIPDGNSAGVNSTIVLPALTLQQAANLKLRLNLSHAWAGDVKVTLTSPCGTTFVFDRPGVPADPFGNGDNFGTTNGSTPPPAVYLFDLAGATIIPESPNGTGIIPGGTYQPSTTAGAAHTWAGLTFPCSTAGAWTLNLSDAAVVDAGTLAEWAILTAGNYTHTLTGPGTIVQNAPTGANNSTGNFSVSGLPPGSHNFTFTSTDVLGCFVSSTVTVNVNNVLAITSQPVDRTICAGQNTTFSVTDNSALPATYQWQINQGAGFVDLTNVAPFSGVTTNTLTVTAASTVYNGNTFRVIVTNNCGSSTSNTVTLTVNPLPAVNVGPSGQCGPVLLTATGNSDTYAWTPATGLSATTGATATASPGITTTYTVTGTITATGCQNSNTVTVLGTPPVPVVTPANPVICAGTITTLSVPATTATFTSTGTITVPAGAPGTTSGIASPYPQTINISGLPTSGVSVQSVTINGITHTFPGDMDVLLQSPTNTNVVLMSDIGGGNDLTGQSYTLSDAAAGVLSATALNPTGTYRPTNSGTTDTWVAPGPGSVTQATPTLSSLTGDLNGTWRLFVVDDAGGDFGSITSWSITFNVPTARWTPVTGLYTDPAATIPYVAGTFANTVYANPTVTTTYTVTNTLGTCNAAAPATVTVTVNPVPTVSVSPTNQCGPVTLTATGTANTYTWSPATGLNTTTGTTVTANPAFNTVYTVTGTITATGCTASASATVYGTPAAPIVTPSSIAICSGTTTTLTASPVTATFSSTGAITIPAGAPGTSSGPSLPYPAVINVSGLPTTGVRVKSITLNGVTHTFPTDIDALVQSPTNTNVVVMSDVGGTTAITGRDYTFDDAAAASMTTATAPAGTYKPSNVTTPDTWIAPGPGSVTQSSPALSLFTGDLNGDWKLFIVDDVGGDVGSMSGWSITFEIAGALWTPVTGLYTDAGATVPYVAGTPVGTVYAKPTATTTYAVTRATATCTSPATNVTVTVHQPITITTQPASQTVCAGANVTFSVVTTGSLQSYQWQVNTGSGFTNITGANSTSYTLNNLTTAVSGYQYRVLVSNSCFNATSNAATLTVNPLPAITLGALPTKICLSDTLVPLVGNPVGGFWSGIGVSGMNFVPPSTAVGTYTLTYSYTSNLGCVNTGTVVAKVEDCPERMILLRDEAVILWPNPNNGRFNIRINSTLYNYLGMRVYTAAGQLVRMQNFGGLVYNRVIPIDMTNLPGGTYMVKFYYDDGVRTSEKTFKVVVGR